MPLSVVFDDATRFTCFNITITDDDVYEQTETFILTLSTTESLPVQITPNVSVIAILDNDGKLGYNSVVHAL